MRFESNLGSPIQLSLWYLVDSFVKNQCHTSFHIFKIGRLVKMRSTDALFSSVKMENFCYFSFSFPLHCLFRLCLSKNSNNLESSQQIGWLIENHNQTLDHLSKVQSFISSCIRNETKRRKRRNKSFHPRFYVQYKSWMQMKCTQLA